jgi:FdhE protein
MTRDAWLANHPYLQPVADLQALVESAATELPIHSARIPPWDDYRNEFHAGVPLLKSSTASIDLGDAEECVLTLIDTLASKGLPATFAEQCRILSVELHGDSETRRVTTSGLLEADSVPTTQPGLLRYLGWTVLGRYLGPVVEAFSRWRNEERWLRNYCPTCGGPPAMAQLIGTDPGRLRLLACGCCSTRWRYRRTGCPFCEPSDDHRLAVVAVDGEGGLRIDYCETCKGYLKTYNGEGSEGVLLGDWTSLHLDVIARERGLKRLAASLYEL